MKQIGRLFKTKLVVTISFLLVSCIFIVAAQEREKGVVASIRDGKLERLVASGWKQLNVRQQVSQGERVRTDKTAVAIIEFPAIARFVMAPSSEIELGKDPKNFQTKLDRGALWLKSDLSKGARASITTALATAGIRGTAFSVCYDGKNYCVCTCSGEVEVTSGDGRAIKVPKGQYLAFTSGSSVPEKPQSAIPLLAKTGTAFDYCFNCHIVGGKGELKRDRK